jgi:hypothetical protein
MRIGDFFGMELLAMESLISCHSLAFARDCDSDVAFALHDSRSDSADMALDRQWNGRFPIILLSLQNCKLEEALEWCLVVRFLQESGVIPDWLFC